MIKEWWERITGIAALRNRVAFLKVENDALFASLMQTHDRAQIRREALRDIIAMETPKSNATVRRMVKRAREAIGSYTYTLAAGGGGAGGVGAADWKPGQPPTSEVVTPGTPMYAGGGAGGPGAADWRDATGKAPVSK